MSEYILSCCSPADLSKEHFERIGVRYVCFHYALDGAEYPDDLGQTIPFDEFYRRMSEGADTRTAQVNVSEYVDFFTPFLEEGKDVVHVCLSSGISGTINSARNAALILKERYPERTVHVIDSLGASSGYGLLMDTAAAKRDEGLSAEELAAWIEENRLKVHHWFFSSDLTFFVKGGRISKAAGVFGGILEICPLMNMDNLGRLIPRFKIRTKKKVIREIVKKMEECAEGGTDYSGKCFISMSACYEDARAVADLVEARFPKLDGKVLINNIGNLIGSHTGPGGSVFTEDAEIHVAGSSSPCRSLEEVIVLIRSKKGAGTAGVGLANASVTARIADYFADSGISAEDVKTTVQQYTGRLMYENRVTYKENAAEILATFRGIAADPDAFDAQLKDSGYEAKHSPWDDERIAACFAALIIE